MKKIILYLVGAALAVSAIPIFSMDPILARLQATEVKAESLRKKYAAQDQEASMKKSTCQVTVEDYDSEEDQREEPGVEYEYYNSAGQQVTKNQYFGIKEETVKTNMPTNSKPLVPKEHNEEKPTPVDTRPVRAKSNRAKRLLSVLSYYGLSAAYLGGLGYLIYSGHTAEVVPECTLFGIYPIACKVAGLQ